MKSGTDDYSTEIDTWLEFLKREWKPTHEQIKLLTSRKEKLNFAVHFLVTHNVPQDYITEIIGSHPSYPSKLSQRVTERLNRKRGEK